MEILADIMYALIKVYGYEKAEKIMDKLIQMIKL